MTAPAAPSRQRTSGFAHRPGLDGLRGAAVAGVLAFHGGFAWAEGGYLGVSAFFTLSGFLIATLLLGEHRRTGRIDLRAFWVRRFRRLLPAALLGVVAATAYVLALGDSVALDRFPGDALAAIGYVANWRFVLSDLSYAELFSGASPLQHYWSLAIEEQFYLVLPLLCVLVLRGRRRTNALRTVALIGLVASVAASLALGPGDRAYYGTDTRMAELCAGVLLAVWHHRNDVERFSLRARTASGAGALAVMVVLWATVPQTADALHPWVLLAHAALTVAVIVAVLSPTPVAAVLSAPPLTALGRLSYGVYVFHWPIFLWLTPDRTGLEGGAVDDALLFALRVAVTLAIAYPSYRLVEQPIRHHGLRLPRPRGPLVAAGAAVAVVAVAVVPATVVDRDPVIDFGAAQALQDDLRNSTGPPASTPRADTGEGEAPSGPAPRVAILGDSTALLFVPGLATWAQATGRMDVVGGFTELGCSLGRGGSRAFRDGEEELREQCDFDVVWATALEETGAEIAVVEIGLWDVVGRRIPGDDRLRYVGDPVYDDFLRRELRAANELLLAHAERAVWILQPTPVPGSREADDPVYEGILRWNRLLLDTLRDEPGVGFVDLDGWLRRQPGAYASTELRPDGTHFTEDTSVDLASWLAPAILEAAARGGVVRHDDVARVPVPRAGA